MNKALRIILPTLAVCASITLSNAVYAYDADNAAISGASPAIEIILAYVDPGSAGFIIVTVLGFLAAAGYTVRVYLSRLKALVFRGAQNDEAVENLRSEGDEDNDAKP